jgi:hypothetical protein
MRTICSVLDELILEARSRDDADGLERLEIAKGMAKRMQNRLKIYAAANRKDPSTLMVDRVGSVQWIHKRQERERRRADKKGTR